MFNLLVIHFQVRPDILMVYKGSIHSKVQLDNLLDMVFHIYKYNSIIIFMFCLSGSWFLIGIVKCLIWLWLKKKSFILMCRFYYWPLDCWWCIQNTTNWWIHKFTSHKFNTSNISILKSSTTLNWRIGNWLWTFAPTWYQPFISKLYVNIILIIP